MNAYNVYMCSRGKKETEEVFGTPVGTQSWQTGPLSPNEAIPAYFAAPTPALAKPDYPTKTEAYLGVLLGNGPSRASSIILVRCFDADAAAETIRLRFPQTENRKRKKEEKQTILILHNYCRTLLIIF